MKSSFFYLIVAIFAVSCVAAEPPAKENKTLEKSVNATVSPDPSVKLKASRRIKTLIVTANFQSPAIIAELARRGKKVPYILLPAMNSSRCPNTPIFFVPADKRDMFAMKDSEYAGFIELLDPERIIILGDDIIVPDVFRPEKSLSREILNVENTSWKANALIVGNLILMRDMEKRYDAAFANGVVEPLACGFSRPEIKEKSKAPKAAPAGNRKPAK